MLSGFSPGDSRLEVLQRVAVLARYGISVLQQASWRPVTARQYLMWGHYKRMASYHIEEGPTFPSILEEKVNTIRDSANAYRLFTSSSVDRWYIPLVISSEILSWFCFFRLSRYTYLRNGIRDEALCKFGERKRKQIWTRPQENSQQCTKGSLTSETISPASVSPSSESASVQKSICSWAAASSF